MSDFDGALCAETDPEIFYPEKGGSNKAAQQLCCRCNLRADCLEVGLTERFGIWGGLSELQRRKIRKDRGITIPADPDPPVDTTKEVA